MTWNAESLIVILCWLIVLVPLASLLVVGCIVAVGLPVEERAINRITQWGAGLPLAAALALAATMLATGQPSVSKELGQWVAIPSEHFHFSFKVVFDPLSITFLILSLGLCAVVGAFGRVYLHLEPGYRRFYLLFAVFQLGMVLSSVAGTIETLFAGWELVGLSSALLVAFFQDRRGPVASALRVWIVYRIADAAFLAAAVALHHVAGAGDFAHMTGAGIWPDGIAPVTSAQAFVVGGLLLVAAAGKSALLPFSGWLPRAMDGPTPSSAIFYGALSIHLGAFLLLRVEPLLDRSPALAAIVVGLGLVTAISAAITARAQTDIKCALAFASLTQVGLIVAEIGLGLRYVALAHIVGNACLRTLQLLRSPSLLHDYHQIENAIGTRPPGRHHAARPGRSTRPVNRWRLALYRFAHQRAFFDLLLNAWLVAPFLRLMRWCDRLERRWMALLEGPSAPPGSAHRSRPGDDGPDELK